MNDALPLDQIPRNPDKAVDFIFEFVDENIDNFYRGDRPTKTRMGSFSEILMMLEFAIRKSKLYNKGYENNPKGEAWKCFLNLKEGHEEFRSGTRVRMSISSIKLNIRLSKIEDHLSNIEEESLFELNEDEILRINELCTEMRSQVITANSFSAQHKQRILNRISQIEQEIHRKDGRLDVILGGVVDIGDALGEFGERAKPLFDRINEIRRITQRNSKEYDQIPPPEDLKLLSGPSDGGGSNGSLDDDHPEAPSSD